eukprot:403340377
MKRKSLNQNQFADWEVGNDYECLKILGQGSYGAVCSAIHKPSGKKVAIKKMDGVFEDDIDCKRILREINLLRKLQHPYVIQVIDVLEPKDKEKFDTIYVVLELAESDLKKVIKSAIHLQIKHIQTIIYNLLCAVKYLHSANVLHRDLKPANVLVNEDCSVKICDFGLARSISGVENTSLMINGRRHRMASDDLGSGESGDDVLLMGAELAKIKSQEEKVSSSMSVDQPPTQQMQALSIEETKAEVAVSEEAKKKDLQRKLLRTKDHRKNMKRELTGHVVTRWYRAPEIILLEKDYGPALDMWSVGCIFAELLGMMKESAPTYLDRKPLFPGKSCFPLSPDKSIKEERKGFPFSKNDQLTIIFDVIGTPLEDDKCFVTDAKAIEYLDAFPRKPRADLSAMYPGAGDDALDLLNKMLVFNPYFRVSVDEALTHPFFRKVKKQEKEVVADCDIQIEFEKDVLDKKKLRSLILEECRLYKQINREKQAQI